MYAPDFKEVAGLHQVAFYNTKVAYQKAAVPRWRAGLLNELHALYDQYPASKKRSRSSASGPVEEVLECVRTYNMDDADNFVDPLLEQPQPQALGRCSSRHCSRPRRRCGRRRRRGGRRRRRHSVGGAAGLIPKNNGD